MSYDNDCVYIMTNRYNTVLYIGTTSNLARRVHEHKLGIGGKFTSKYQLTKLVYFECSGDMNAAIAREKQLKGGSRAKKIELINNINPEWRDLSEDW
jgi:Predicted endonuclease containing a URI domain